MPEMNYGKRTCLQCGTKFEATHPAHITCSTKCAEKRRIILKRECDSRYRAKHKKYLLDLLADLDAAYADREWLSCRCEAEIEAHKKSLQALTDTYVRVVAKLEDQLKAAQEELDALRVAAEKQADATASSQTPQFVLKECKRMHLRATTLPCGQREECFTPPCEKLGKQKKNWKMDKLCPTCKEPFTPKVPIQKYCCTACRLQASMTVK